MIRPCQGKLRLRREDLRRRQLPWFCGCSSPLRPSSPRRPVRSNARSTSSDRWVWTKKLAWQIFRIAAATSPITEVRNIPASSSIRRLKECARRKKLDKVIIDELATAYEQFEAFASVHAGTREGLISMLSGISEQKNDAFEVKVRKGLFKGNAHVWGMQADLSSAPASSTAGPGQPTSKMRPSSTAKWAFRGCTASKAPVSSPACRHAAIRSSQAPRVQTPRAHPPRTARCILQRHAPSHAGTRPGQRGDRAGHSRRTHGCFTRQSTRPSGMNTPRPCPRPHSRAAHS